MYGLDWHIMLAGRHIHTDHYLVDVQMSDGLQGVGFKQIVMLLSPPNTDCAVHRARLQGFDE